MGTYDTRGGTPQHDPIHDAPDQSGRWDGPEVHGSLGNAAIAERMQDAMNGLADAYVESAHPAWHEIDDSREQDLREAAMAYALMPVRERITALERERDAHATNTAAVIDLNVWMQQAGNRFHASPLGELVTVAARAEIEACHKRIAELEARAEKAVELVHQAVELVHQAADLLRRYAATVFVREQSPATTAALVRALHGELERVGLAWHTKGGA